MVEPNKLQSGRHIASVGRPVHNRSKKHLQLWLEAKRLHGGNGREVLSCGASCVIQKYKPRHGSSCRSHARKLVLPPLSAMQNRANRLWCAGAQGPSTLERGSPFHRRLTSAHTPLARHGGSMGLWKLHVLITGCLTSARLPYVRCSPIRLLKSKGMPLPNPEQVLQCRQGLFTWH